MKSKPHFRVLGVAAALAAIALVVACNDTATTAAGNGTIAVQLADAPFPSDSVQSVDVFVVRVDARAADADDAAAAQGTSDESANADGWTTLASPNQSVNLLAYQNGAVLPLGQATLGAGNYLGFRLVIDPSKSGITLKNGMVLTGTSTPNIMFPSASRSGIKIAFAQSVVVIAGQTTTVLIDFMVGDSFVMRGNSIGQNGLLFKPVVKGSVKP